VNQFSPPDASLSSDVRAADERCLLTHWRCLVPVAVAGQRFFAKGSLPMKLPSLCCRILLGASILWLVTAGPARSAFIISGTDTTVAVGGYADVNFYVSSDANDTLSSFQLQLLISGLSVGSLPFANTQPDAFLNDPQYVFFNNSSVVAYSAPFWGGPSSTFYDRDTITGGDVVSADAVAVGLSPKLLATVRVYADLNVVEAGQSFQISLVPASPSEATTTYFADNNGLAVDFRSTPTTVLVTPAEVNSVPAPPSLVLAGFGGLTGLLYSWRRHRSRRVRLLDAVRGG
jgi:hypothetical protein